MKKLLTILTILLSLQSFSQQDNLSFFKIKRAADYVSIKSTVTNIDTLTCPDGLTVMYDLFLSGGKKTGKKTIAITNTAGIYSIDRNLTPASFNGGTFDVVLINKMVIVQLTTAVISKVDWVYKKI